MSPVVNSNHSSTPNERLWYPQPAQYWNSQSLLLGNGRVGVSFMGGVQTEEFALSEKSIWTGGPFRGDWEEVGVNPKAITSLPEIRRLSLAGEIEAADQLTQDDFIGKNRLFGAFSSIGSLKLQMYPPEKIHRYCRSLDLSSALGEVSYQSGDVHYHREYFCSSPHQIFAIKLEASQKGALSFSLSFDSIQESCRVLAENDSLTLDGEIDGNQRPFQVKAKVITQGGSQQCSEGSLTVHQADSAIIYVAIATNYKLEYPAYQGDPPEKIIHQTFSSIQPLSYDALKEAHIADYQQLYQRTSLKLPANPSAETLPTHERYAGLKQGVSDPGYKELMFNLGKYLLISSSRQGSLPANLQGVWNIFKTAPWLGNYQSNINIQEIYWPCGILNLSECQEPLIDWIEDLVEPGREIARRCYGTAGWVSHSTGNIWGHAAPDNHLCYGLYPVGAAWHCRHLWEHFSHGQNIDYLRNRAYPLMKEASLFWMENLVEYHGHLISAPTVSAEHGVVRTADGLNPAPFDNDLDKSEYLYTLPGAYQDVEMIWDLFTNTAEAAEILGDTETARRLKDKKDQLLPLKIGKQGQLQEWEEDLDHPDCHHRHIAHLYAVAPGRQIHPTTTPELAQAAKKALDMRGDGHFPEPEFVTGGNWARAHRMACWVRLMDGNRANKILSELITEQGFENGLTFQHLDNQHNIGPSLHTSPEGAEQNVQLDASVALCSVMAEMLLQSHLGELHLLPALPAEFHSGRVCGLRAHGGHILDIEWKDGILTKAHIRLNNTSIPKIRLKNRLVNPLADARFTCIQPSTE